LRFATISAEPSFIHRLHNFTEDLHVELHRRGYGSVPNMDSAIDEVIVSVPSKRYVGDALRILRSLLKQHHLAQDATIDRHTR
jgi:hypothetical protein